MTSSEVRDTGPNPAPRTGRWSQVGLSTLLLATACAAVWFAVWTTRQKINAVKERLSVTQSLVRELALVDRDHLSAIAQEQFMFDEFAWYVFVPSEGYNLCLATKGIPNNMGGPVTPSTPLPAEDSVKLSPGQHTISLSTYQQGNEWLIEVQVDLEQVMLIHRPLEWNPNSGSAGGSLADQQVDKPAGESLPLFQRAFMQKQPPGGGAWKPTQDATGVQLWIEPQSMSR